MHDKTHLGIKLDTSSFQFLPVLKKALCLRNDKDKEEQSITTPVSLQQRAERLHCNEEKKKKLLTHQNTPRTTAHSTEKRDSH